MMKKIFILICIFSSLFSISYPQPLSGGVKFEKILNNAPELIRYVALGDINNVEKLLKNKSDPNQKFMKISPLFVAIYKDYPDILFLLLSYGADPNDNYLGETLLGFAIYRDSFNCLKVLIEGGADINLKSLNNLPLNISLQRKRFDMAKFLYSVGAKQDKKTLKLLKRNKIKF